MKGIDKITAGRLAEVLTERAVVATEVIADALYAQEKGGESFAQVLVSGGHITEWDLAKIVTECFNLPFLMAGNYQISDEAKKRLPKETLFRYTLVPLDVFGDIVCVSVPLMLTFEEISRIQKDHGCDLFPYVGLISENRRVLSELHKDYKEWLDRDGQRREEEAKRRAQAPVKAADNWMSIFDAGDAAIQDRKKPAAPVDKPASGSVGGSAMSVFDAGDAAIQEARKKTAGAPKAPPADGEKK